MSAGEECRGEKAERKLGWGRADTVSFPFDSLCLLSHPCDKLSKERVRLCVHSLLVHMPSTDSCVLGLLETDFGHQPALPSRTSCWVCLLTHRDAQRPPKSRAGVAWIGPWNVLFSWGWSLCYFFLKRSFVKSRAPPAVRRWGGFSTGLLRGVFFLMPRLNFKKKVLMGHLELCSGTAVALAQQPPPGGQGVLGWREEVQRLRQDRVISMLLLLLASPYPCTPTTASSLAKVISLHSFAAVLKF